MLKKLCAITFALCMVATASAEVRDERPERVIVKISDELIVAIVQAGGTIKMPKSNRSGSFILSFPPLETAVLIIDPDIINPEHVTTVTLQWANPSLIVIDAVKNDEYFGVCTGMIVRRNGPFELQCRDGLKLTR